MNPVFQELIHQAESQYLKPEQIEQLNTEVSTLKQRLNLYKTLRDKEIVLFQEIADQLILKLPDENHQNIENCLRQWLLTTRYCAMAMLLNNPEFLEHRLLEWLTDIIQVHQTQSISDNLYSLLIKKLNKIVSDTELSYITPFLNQAKDYFSKASAFTN